MCSMWGIAITLILFKFFKLCLCHPCIYRELTNTISHLNAAVQTYYNLGISPATTKAYTASVRKYTNFCSEATLQLTLVSEDTLMLFTTYLAEQKLSYPTIRVYLSAVRYNCTTLRESLPLTTPYILKGIRKSQAMTYQPRERLPITFPIMILLHQAFTNNSNNYWYVMIWAACCLAYFGLLRVSEFTSTRQWTYCYQM